MATYLEFSIKSDLSLLNKPLKELSLKPNVLIAGIIRDRQTIIPSGDDMLLCGDKVIVLSLTARLQDLSDILR